MSNYSLTSPIDSRVARLIDDCRNKRVIHIGCADVPYTQSKLDLGTLLHRYLLDASGACVGVDTSINGIQLLAHAFPGTLYYTPADTKDLINFAADVIVVGEVVEHLRNFDSFFKMMKIICHPRTEVIITTPNAYSLKGALRALVGKEFQHPDHVCLFSPNTLSRLLTDYGFKPTLIDFYNNPPQSFVTKLVGLPVNFALRISPRASDGLYLKASIQ